MELTLIPSKSVHQWLRYGRPNLLAYLTVLHHQNPRKRPFVWPDFRLRLAEHPCMAYNRIPRPVKENLKPQFVSHPLRSLNVLELITRNSTIELSNFIEIEPLLFVRSRDSLNHRITGRKDTSSHRSLIGSRLECTRT